MAIESNDSDLDSDGPGAGWLVEMMAERDCCAVCRQTFGQLHVYEGELLCETHLQERLAQQEQDVTYPDADGADHTRHMNSIGLDT